MATITETYATYQDALAACGSGYHADDIAAVIALRTKAIAQGLPGLYVHPDYWAMLAMAVGMASRRGTPVRVLDFGGGCGLHYHCIRALVPGVAVRWSVVETPTMAGRAAATFHDDSLSFVTSVEDGVRNLGGCDIVYASGSLPYVADPEETLRQLLAPASPFFVLARFPIHRGSRCVGVQTSMLSQNGPGPMPPGIPEREVRYPVTFLLETEVMPVIRLRYGRMEEIPTTTWYAVKGTHIDAPTFLFHGQDNR
jgi:putative methyltransferase (TIGR04325 family)